MPEYYSKCPLCMQPNFHGGLNPALIVEAIKPISELSGKITDVSNEAAKRRENKREKLGRYERQKQDLTIKYFNKLKKQRKQGKLPPNLRTDAELWEYATSQAEGNGLFYTDYEPSYGMGYEDDDYTSDSGYSSSDYSSEEEEYYY